MVLPAVGVVRRPWQEEHFRQTNFRHVQHLQRRSTGITKLEKKAMLTKKLRSTKACRRSWKRLGAEGRPSWRSPRRSITGSTISWKWHKLGMNLTDLATANQSIAEWTQGSCSDGKPSDSQETSWGCVEALKAFITSRVILAWYYSCDVQTMHRQSVCVASDVWAEVESACQWLPDVSAPQQLCFWCLYRLSSNCLQKGWCRCFRMTNRGRHPRISCWL